MVRCPESGWKDGCVLCSLVGKFTAWCARTLTGKTITLVLPSLITIHDQSEGDRPSSMITSSDTIDNVDGRQASSVPASYLHGVSNSKMVVSCLTTNILQGISRTGRIGSRNKCSLVDNSGNIAVTTHKRCMRYSRTISLRR
jgi:hypothetical protein